MKENDYETTDFGILGTTLTMTEAYIVVKSVNEGGGYIIPEAVLTWINLYAYKQIYGSGTVCKILGD